MYFHILLCAFILLLNFEHFCILDIIIITSINIITIIIIIITSINIITIIIIIITIQVSGSPALTDTCMAAILDINPLAHLKR